MENKNTILITKASGSVVPFSEEKLKASLRKSGATDDAVNSVIDEIQLKLYSGISTKKIYRIAFNMLKKSSGHLAARYHLKKAIMELGPSGYPFERFVAEVLKQQGYKTQVGIIVKGKCVDHEVDVIAEKDNHHFMIECKYHNLQGRVNDVKIPLYIQARFKDVEQEWIKLPGHENKIHQGWVVTNTKFTSDALKYGVCAGLHLLSWDYPTNDSLRDQIDKSGLYPITCITSLTKTEKQQLLNSEIILSKDLIEKETLLSSMDISRSRINSIIKEIKTLCTTKTT